METKIDNTIQNYNVTFWNMVIKYDTSNTNILRKIIHSFTVANNCFDIASYFGLSKKEREFAYLLGLFHDIGRFEQWKLYQTFFDKKSVDHGDLGAEIIEKIPKNALNLSENDKKIMVEAIKYHTKEYNGKDEKIAFYNSIIKNADAYSNILTTANGTQQLFVKGDGFTKEILNDFLNQKKLLGHLPNSNLDRILMMTANCYYVNLEFLRKEILDKKYIDSIFEVYSVYLNENDKKVYRDAIEHLKQNYLNKKTC